MERDQIVEYIEARYEILKQPHSSSQRQSFSFEAPHTCDHCQKVLVNVSVRGFEIRCIKCGWDNDGEPPCDNRTLICGRCGESYADGLAVRFTANPTYNVLEASKSGCPLYEWLVDVFIRNIVRSTDLNSNSSELAPRWRAHKGLHSSAPAFDLSSLTFLPDPNVTCMLGVGFNLSLKDLLVAPYQPRLQCWTLERDAASRYLTSRPYERDVKSTESLKFADDCFQFCLGMHGGCRQVSVRQKPGEALPDEVVEIDRIPSRLLDIRPEDGRSDIKITELEEADSQTRIGMSAAGFVALSYCWGGDQPVKLVKESHQQLKQGIPLVELSQTLQDAVWVTRNIGGKYLWVDSLCIVQDDKDDKAREIGRMAIYYGSAKLTICAASSAQSTEGFLGMRQASSYEFGPIRLPLRDKDGDAGQIYLLKEGTTAAEPTTTRAWTLQESLLSRRILIFAQKQLYWCCVTSYAGCGGDLVKLVERVMGAQESLIENIYPMGSLLDRPTENQWRVIVEEFTRRQLSFESDKLLAISALAANLDQICKVRQEATVYLAGLFVNTDDATSWATQLLWSPDLLVSERPTPYRAPSWSWAAVTGPIRVDIFDHQRFDAYLSAKVYFTVEGFQVDLEYPSRPFGSVTRGLLTLRARLHPLKHNSSLASHFVGPEGDSATDPNPRINLYPDTIDDRNMIEASLDPAGSKGGSLLLVCLWLDRSWAEGLIIAPSAIDDETHTRVGVFHALWNFSELSRSIFSDCKHQTVRLV